MIKLKPVSDEDCMKIWQLANDPEVRAASFSSESIPYENHQKWFSTRMSDPGCRFYTAFDIRDRFVGQLRFELNADQATISVSLNRKFRGRGYGTKLILLGLQNIFKSSEADVINAYVKRDNTASLKAFKKAGFKIVDKLTIAESPAFHLTIKRNKKNGTIPENK